MFSSVKFLMIFVAIIGCVIHQGQSQVSQSCAAYTLTNCTAAVDILYNGVTSLPYASLTTTGCSDCKVSFTRKNNYAGPVSYVAVKKALQDPSVAKCPTPIKIGGTNEAFLTISGVADGAACTKVA